VAGFWNDWVSVQISSRGWSDALMRCPGFVPSVLATPGSRSSADHALRSAAARVIGPLETRLGVSRTQPMLRSSRYTRMPWRAATASAFARV
jgi:hypothetical protein